MTPTEIETAARNKYNAVGDSFWSQLEIMDLIYAACNEMAQRARVIERAYTTPTVAATQEYAQPTYAFEIKRITYDGTKLIPINMREDDWLTGNNADTTQQGTPQYYYLWDQTIVLRPIPDSVGTLKIYTYNVPQTVTNTSTLEVPIQYHHNIVDYVLREMFAKEREFSDMYTLYDKRWEAHIKNAIRDFHKRKRGDQFAVVQDEGEVDRMFTGVL